MSSYLAEVGGGQRTARSLSLQEAEEAFRYIFEGKSSEAQTAAFLVALRIKGGSDDERLALLNVLREYNEEKVSNIWQILIRRYRDSVEGFKASAALSRILRVERYCLYHALEGTSW